MSHTTLQLHSPRRRSPDTVLEVRGEIDLSNASELRDALAQAGDVGGGRVVVDLSAVEFLDSTALGVLVAGAKRLREDGGDLVIRAPQPRIRRVFELTGLDRVFDLVA
jgi:anti-sigma B factor antagonist